MFTKGFSNPLLIRFLDNLELLINAPASTFCSHRFRNLMFQTDFKKQFSHFHLGG